MTRVNQLSNAHESTLSRLAWTFIALVSLFCVALVAAVVTSDSWSITNALTITQHIFGSVRTKISANNSRARCGPWTRLLSINLIAYEVTCGRDGVWLENCILIETDWRPKRYSVVAWTNVDMFMLQCQIFIRKTARETAKATTLLFITKLNYYFRLIEHPFADSLALVASSSRMRRVEIVRKMSRVALTTETVRLEWVGIQAFATIQRIVVRIILHAFAVLPWIRTSIHFLSHRIKSIE